MNNKKRTVLLFGRSRAGKSSQLAALAEHVKIATGKITRLYSADRGGTGPLQPLIDLGVVELVEMRNTDPWIFLNKSVNGYMRDDKGKWVPGKNDNIGMFAFESMTSFADELMASMAQKAGEGVNIGGGGNIAFQVNGDGESLKISGSNMAHFGTAQSRITSEVWKSQRLPADAFILWTASLSKDDDSASSGKVLGPQVCGKALTSEVTRWFDLSFRIDCLPAQQGKPERHILYLGNSVDLAAGNAVVLGNTRTALDAPQLPSTIEPANLVQAIKMIDDANAIALETVRKRLKVG